MIHTALLLLQLFGPIFGNTICVSMAQDGIFGVGNRNIFSFGH